VPITTDFEKKYIHIRLSGHYTFEESLEAIEGVVDDERFAKGMHLLIDITDSEETRTSHQMEELAARIGAMRIHIGRRVGLCVKQAHHYGLARMHSTFAARYGMKYRVFVDREEAMDWLSQEA
jgi:hypothetical protein